MSAVAAKPVFDFSALTPEERLELIEQLWDSIDSLPAALSEEQAEELERRVKRVSQDGLSGTTVPELRTRLLGS